MDALKEWAGRRVLVTGGSGFVGQHVVAQGLAMGMEIHILSRSGHTPEGTLAHPVDLTERARLFEVMAQVRPDGIIHLAAAGVVVQGEGLEPLLRANAGGTDNLLAAAEALGTRPPVVLAGSGFEYAPQPRAICEADPLGPFSPYGVSKAAATFAAGLYAGRLPITVLRLFSLYGPGEREPRLAPYIIGAARRGERVELTAGEQVRDYTFVADAAEAFWHALALPPAEGALTILNVGSGLRVTLRHFVTTLAALLQEQGLAPNIAFGVKPYRAGEPMVYVADVAQANKVLQWSARTTLYKGLTTMLKEEFRF